MPRPKNPVPLPRPHSSGQARVTIEGKDYLLGGPLGSPEADANYKRILAQFLAREGPFAVDQGAFTCKELAAAYWTFAERYYGYDKEPRRGDACNLKRTLAIFVELFGTKEARAFGPLDLRAVQGEMIRGEVADNGDVVRVGWCRNVVNQQCSRLKQCFRWAVTEELIPPATWQALLAVPGLRRGKTEARETAPVRPAPAADIEAAKEKLRPVVRAMVDFMLLTAARPNEVCQLRPCDLDKTNAKCWLFRPMKAKTDHHGHERIILVGPKAQEAILPFLEGLEPSAWVFSPRRGEAQRNAERSAQRKSKPTPSATERAAKAKRRQRRRAPTDRYTTASLRRAIARACELAGVPAFGPNRLRHARATGLREHGLDVVATVLGHSKIETTQVYSERNLDAAMKIIEVVG